METLKYVFSEELPDDTFLQYMQTIWAEFSELAPDELKSTPPFQQFAADLVQLEKAVVTNPLSTTGRKYVAGQAQLISEARHQITQSYGGLIEQLDTHPLDDTPAAYHSLIDGLRTAQRQTHPSANLFKKQLQHLVLLLLLLFIGGVGQVMADGTIQLNGNNKPTFPPKAGIVLDDNAVCLNTGTYRLTGTSQNYRIWIYKGETVSLTISNVNIDLSRVTSTKENASAIQLGDNAKLTLTLEGNNYMYGGYEWAGIGVFYGQTLTINGSGSLTVYGGEKGTRSYQGGAGIGGCAGGYSAGTININDGIIRAYGGPFSAGIGGGSISGGASSGDVGNGAIYTQTGGYVYARGGTGGAGVGGAGAVTTDGSPYDRNGGDNVSTTITGGYLNGDGSGGGAGIGGGGSRSVVSSSGSAGNGGSGGTITISGGTVFGFSSDGNNRGGGAAIGGGGGSTLGNYNGSGGNGATVKITNGSVYGSSSGGIGGGRRGPTSGADGSPGDISNGSGKVHRVKVNSFGLSRDIDYPCSYNGGTVFRARPIEGYYYFWMNQSSTPKDLTINGMDMKVESVQPNDDNQAPIIVKKGSTNYYTFKDGFDAAGDGESLVLQYSYPLAETITLTRNLTFNLNGYELKQSSGGGGAFSVTGGSLTFVGTTGSKVTPPISMTTGGLVKLSGTNVALPNVQADGTPVYFTTVTIPSYGDITDTKLLYNKASLPQYNSGRTYYAWLSGTQPVSMTTSDSHYFKGSLTASPTAHYQNLALEDYTTTFNLKDGNIAVLANGQITYAGATRTSLNNSEELTILGSGSSSAVTVNSNRAITFSDAIGGQLSAAAGTLTMKGSATFGSVGTAGTGALNLTGVTALTVTTATGFPLNAQITLGASQPAITLAGSRVWAAQISANYGALTDVKHGTTSLALGQRYFGATSPYYFWLNDATDDLSFTAGSPGKYYYATVTKAHNQALLPDTYKARITAGGNDTFYKGLSEAFTAAATGQTITLTDDNSLGQEVLSNKNLILDLNGKELRQLNAAGKLTVSAGNLTCTGMTGSKVISPVKMTGSGLLKLSGTSVALSEVQANNVPVYFTTITIPTYGDIDGKVLKYNNASLPQYSSGRVFYTWIPGILSATMDTEDGLYFKGNLSTAPTTHYQTLALSDYTSTFNLKDGAVSVLANGTVNYIGGSRTSLNAADNLTITGTGSTGDVTVSSNRTVTFDNASGRKLSAAAGTLTMKGSATFSSVEATGALNLTGATALTVTTATGFPLNAQITLGATQPAITLAGSKVWAAQIAKTNYGPLTEVKHGATTLVQNQRYFGATFPYYFWVNEAADDLIFTAGSPAGKYYYATVTKAAHNQALLPDTYKARITVGNNATFYKGLPLAFAAATTGQTITLIDSYTPASPESVSLNGSSSPEVTFDLAAYTLGGTFTMNANGGRLILQGSNNGKLTAKTTLSGLVYTEMAQGNLGVVTRNGQEVNRYMAKDVLASSKVTVAWNNSAGTDQAMVKDGKACLWLPGGLPLERVDLGYSAQMSTDKCGEILSVGTLTTHSINPTTVNPYLNIARSHLLIENSASQLKLTHNATSAQFAAAQPITLYGTGTNRIQVTGGADVQHLTLRNLSIPLTATQSYAPVSVEGTSKLTLFLSGKNRLQGAGKSGSVTAGISVASDATLTIQNDDAKDEQQNGMGELYVKGGANINDAAAGIGGNNKQPAGTIIINGGTIQAEGGLPTLWGIGDGKGAQGGHKPVIISAGSVNTNREWTTATVPHPFVNNGKDSNKEPVYLVTVNTGLTPNKKYICTYYKCNPEPFPVQTDEYGKCYFWMPKRVQTDKPEATFRDPATNNTTTIQLVKVDENDKNVAPIVAELIQEGQPAEYHNNLKDAFDAVKAANATIRLLIDIDNLSSMQTVKSGHRVTLDLDRFNLDTKNSKVTGFNAEVGGYLFITGEGESGTGNIKSTFKINGDIYIAGIVPLTDATPLQNEKAVFRTLVKGLPENASNIYTYSYGSISNRTFYMHDGLACLWLPDGSGELTFRVTQGSNVTDYTAGTITTNTQRTEAITCQPVGVVARVVKGEAVQDFNNLPEAFTTAAATPGNTVLLLANIALTKPLTVGGSNDFTLDLNGMSLTGATGTTLTLSPGRYLTILDRNAGVKGSVQMDVILNGRLFVSGNITVKGNVTRDAGYVWRTMADVSNLANTPTAVKLGEVTSTVVNREACFWLSEAKNQSYTFADGGTTYPVNGVNINNNHQDNLVTLGVGNDEVQITGKKKYATFAVAWNAAIDGDEIVLLKDAALSASLTLTAKKVQIDLARYSLTALTESVSLAVGQDATLIVRSSNGNGRMLVPVTNNGLLYIGQSVQADRLSNKITNGSGAVCWRALVTSLPDGMPDDGVYDYTFASQSGSFYVKDKTACLWLQPEMAQKMSFTQFNSFTDNVTIETHHANQIVWGQSFVAQVQNNMYTRLDEAFSKNSNQTVTLLKSAVLATSQTIGTQMKLEMGGYSISPQGNPAPGFTIAPGGSLQVTGVGNLSTHFTIDFSTPVNGSNANLTIAAQVNMNSVNVTNSNEIAYFRTTVTLPAGVRGELTYSYGEQTGKVYAVDGQPLTLWLTVPDSPQDMKLTQEQDSWIATAVKIVATHVNPVTVQSISDEASIPAGDGSNAYYKTLREALAAATDGQRIVVERNLNQVAGPQALVAAGATGKVTLDLSAKKLTAIDATFDAGAAQLIMKNGNLNGSLTLHGNVFAHPSLSMNNTWVSDGNGKTIWRTLVQLPAGTKGTISYIRSGETAETSTANILDIDGVPYACLWLNASNEVKDYVFTTSDQKVYPVNNVIISSNHGNELNVVNNDPVVKDQDGKEYASLNTALNAPGSKTLILLKDITISLSQTVNNDITLDLNGTTMTSSNSGGFNPAERKTLKLINSRIDEGMMVGTFTLTNDRVFASKTVDIVGVMRNATGKKIWRVLVSGLPANEKACLWQETTEFECDYPFVKGDDTFEATIPASLSDHNTETYAYKRIVLTQDMESWKADYAGTNLILERNVTLDISTAAKGSTIHRLTFHDGALIAGTTGQVQSQEGIRYIRTFVPERWESVSLPYTVVRIMTVLTDPLTSTPRTTLLIPASGTGATGNFWLKNIREDGSQQTVNSTDMIANISYIMAVPEDLRDKEITFVSTPGQLLRRDKVLAVKPVSGFAPYANGTLSELKIDEPCYVLNANGTLFERQDAGYKLPPFRGYLLADVTITASTLNLAVGTPTDISVIQPAGSLRIYTRPGYIVVETTRPERLMIFTMTGYCVRSTRLNEGTTEFPMERGVYIVNRTKVVVR